MKNVTVSEVFDASNLNGIVGLHYAVYVNEKNKTPWTFLVEDGGHKFIIHHDKAHQCGYATKEEAEIARDKFIKSLGTDEVFVVLKNADFTEGRGPMVFDSVWSSYSKAADYIMDQDGIFGSKPYEHVSFGVNIHGEMYGSVTFNGYEIKRGVIDPK